jgi:hypothetical protein
MKKKAPSGAATRKERLRTRAESYQDSHEELHPLDAWLHWENGYRAALRDVRRAAGKGGIPSKLVKLLQPIR